MSHPSFPMERPHTGQQRAVGWLPTLPPYAPSPSARCPVTPRCPPSRTQINFTVAIDFTASNGEWAAEALGGEGRRGGARQPGRPSSLASSSLKKRRLGLRAKGGTTVTTGLGPGHSLALRAPGLPVGTGRAALGPGEPTPSAGQPPGGKGDGVRPERVVLREGRHAAQEPGPLPGGGRPTSSPLLTVSSVGWDRAPGSTRGQTSHC